MTEQSIQRLKKGWDCLTKSMVVIEEEIKNAVVRIEGENRVGARLFWFRDFEKFANFHPDYNDMKAQVKALSRQNHDLEEQVKVLSRQRADL